MQKIQTLLSQFSKNKNNPFQDILSALGTDTIVITMEYLGALKNICADYNVNFTTYGAVFDMLRFLELNKCVSIQENEKGEYTMTGLYQYGKNN